MSDRTVILECINKMKRKEETMTNWKLHKEEAFRKADEIAGKKNIAIDSAFIEALLEISHKDNITDAIDWLTQEVENEESPCETCKNCDVTICGIGQSSICNECERNDLAKMEHKATGDYYEAESEERNCAYCKYTDAPGFLEPCKGCMEQNRKDDTYPYFEPQNEEEEHYKAKFIANGDDYINIQHISNISEVEDKTYIFVDGNEHAFIVDKPVNEVIQQLGIEVV